MIPVTETDVAHALSAFGAPEIPYRSFNNVLTPAEPGAAPPVSAEAFPLLADSLPGAAERLGAWAGGMGAPAAAPEPPPPPPPLPPAIAPQVFEFQPRPAPSWLPVEHRLADHAAARPRRVSLAEMFRVLAGGAAPPPASAAELHDMFRRLA
jgi:hypothetical protein